MTGGGSTTWNNHLVLTNDVGEGASLLLDARNRGWAIIATNPASRFGDQKLVFYNAGAGLADMAIDSTGRVGIGTPNPGVRLHVVTSADVPTALFDNLHNTGYAEVRLRQARLIGSTPAAVVANTALGGFTFAGYTGTDYDRSASILTRAAANWSDTSTPSYMLFTTTPSGTNSEEERLRITAAGDVGIGTPNPQGKLDVNGTIFQRGAQLHADHVFQPGYLMESIEDHAAFMWRHSHLEAVPPRQVDEQGREVIEWGAHSRGILEEMEKAHIYIEQLNSRLKAQEEEMRRLRERIAALEQQQP